MSASMTQDETPMATAGAGPSSAIASTIARNAPESRRLRISTITRSLVIARTSSSRTSDSGRQSSARLTVAATTADDTSMDPATSISVVRLFNAPPVIGTLGLGLRLTTQRLGVLPQELE